MIVQDVLDPSGMFSKAGRQSLEMYTLLQEKDAVLHNKPKAELLEAYYNKSSSAASFHTKQQQQQHSQQQLPTLATTAESKMKNNTSQAKIQSQPFFKTVSRDQRSELEVKDKGASRFGMYNPKFHLVFGKSSLYPDLNSEENKQRIREFHQQNLHFNNENSTNNAKKLKRNPINNTSQNRLLSPAVSSSALASAAAAAAAAPNSNYNNNNSLNHSSIGGIGEQSALITQMSMLGIDFDKPQRHIRCPIPFDKQAGRKSMLASTSPHEKRFEVLETSFVSSKTPYLQNISFDLQTKDNPRAIAPKTGGLDYNVNYSSVHTRSNIGIIDFSKSASRSAAVGGSKSPVYTLNEQRGRESDYYSLAQPSRQLMRKVSAPHFAKMSSRGDLTAFHDAKISQLDAIKAQALKQIRK